MIFSAEDGPKPPYSLLHISARAASRAVIGCLCKAELELNRGALSKARIRCGFAQASAEFK